VHHLPREVLRKRDRHRTSIKFRLRIIRWVPELFKRPSQLSVPVAVAATVAVTWKVRQDKRRSDVSRNALLSSRGQSYFVTWSGGGYWLATYQFLGSDLDCSTGINWIRVTRASVAGFIGHTSLTYINILKFGTRNFKETGLTFFTKSSGSQISDSNFIALPCAVTQAWLQQISFFHWQFSYSWLSFWEAYLDRIRIFVRRWVFYWIVYINMLNVLLT
jgi:hypothetical protein